MSIASCRKKYGKQSSKGVQLCLTAGPLSPVAPEHFPPFYHLALGWDGRQLY